MRLRPFLLFILTLYACNSSRDSSQGQLRESIDSLFNTIPDFSGVVLVADHGERVYHHAFGYEDFQKGIPMDTNAVFEWASVSKQFTAMIIMMLQEQSLLDFDDPLEKYIPGLPYPSITIRHLLNHTSGLPDYQAVMDEHWDKSQVAGNEDNIAYLRKYHPERRFMPGEKYEYSNTGYMLLASIAEKASGKDFVEMCRAKIFRPLSMQHTDIRTRADKADLEEMARGHLFVAEKQTYINADSFPEFNYSIWLGNRKGPGRVSGTASDLLKWDQSLYSETLVKKQTLEKAYSPARLNDGTLSQYGFGWMLNNHPTLGKMVLHTGDNPGYRTIIIRYIDKRETLILFCNNDHPKFDEVVKFIDNAIAQSL